MRGSVDNAPRPAVSLVAGLPAAFFGNDLTTDLVEAFDEVLGPVVATLDDLAAYVDARYAPDDCVVWLGRWINVLVDSRWPAERVRRHLPDLVVAMTCRGTIEGIVAGVRACTGQDPTVTDNGGVAWSERPQGEPPGVPRLRLEVVAHLAESDGDLVRSLVHAVVADLKPAHVPAVVRFG